MRSRVSRVSVTILTIAIMVVAAACSSSSTTAPVAPPATGGGGGGGGAKSVTIQAGANGSLAFSPSNVSVKTGGTVTVKNVSSVSHTFTISGQGIDVTVTPGQSQTVNITLKPGTYPFFCRFHQASGMTGTLTVT